MRLKSFTAPSVAEAMALVCEAFGDNAVIISTQAEDDGPGVVVTAALESRDSEEELAALLSGDDRREQIDAVDSALGFHGVPARSVQQLLDAAEMSAAGDASAALASALKAQFRFAGLTLKSISRPIMLVGAPGVGKSVTAAKIGTRALLAKRPFQMISTDSVRAGAIDQLAAYADIMGTELKAAETPTDLRNLIAEAPRDAISIIDTSGANPFSTEDMGGLAKLIDCAPIEPVLVAPAGGDVAEAGDVAGCFRGLGVSRFVATRLDMTRRLGSVLATAAAGPLAFSDVSISAHAARGLKSLTARALARLLMRDPEISQPHFPAREAAQ
ncbi:MAG: GTP-binding protein [Alphaproteobacteria bacterium]|jgi:flagellar biosynthesis protein FlhF|nr:GTP-binding protein [Alphaproteobacteria bacterium]MDP6516837.1 GTP-binding protein [Alphaproteobacteria bacterium]